MRLHPHQHCDCGEHEARRPFLPPQKELRPAELLAAATGSQSHPPLSIVQLVAICQPTTRRCVCYSLSGCVMIPGSQQQRQAVVAQLLVEALGAGGGGVHQAGVGGAPLLRDQPGAPRQQRLKLCTTHRKSHRKCSHLSCRRSPRLYSRLFLTSAVLGVALPQGGDGLDDVLVETLEQRDGGGPLSPADRVAVRPRADRFLQGGWDTSHTLENQDQRVDEKENRLFSKTT